MAETRLPVVVLISGGGSNLQSLIDRSQRDLPIEIRAVISNEADAYGLERAKKAGIPTAVVDHRAYPDRDAYDEALMAHIDHYGPALVVLAGFMRILTPAFVQHYHGRLLNIHPSLLPRHRGLHTHRRALEAGDAVHGASVHFVTEELDGGPVVAQVRVPVKTDDSAEQLAARVLAQEHRLYPLVVDWFARGRLQLGDDGIELDGKKRLQPLVFDAKELPEQ